MKKSSTIVLLLVAMLLTIATVNTKAQLNNYDLKLGLQANYLGVWTEFEADGLSYLIRPFIRYELGSMFDLELGAGYGIMEMKDYAGNHVSTSIIPVDLRLLFSPIESDSWNPYLYLGFGGVYWSLDEAPIDPKSTGYGEDSQFDMALPVGLGAEFSLSAHWLLDLSVGLTVIDDDYVNGYATPNPPSDANKYDKYWTAGIGIAYSFGGCEVDPDKDGLTTCEEEIIGTDPLKADSDGDGLKDGEEVQKYNTDPLKADSDSDGLNDGEEVHSYKTSPTKADTDGDGLNDGNEVNSHNTDPLKADTDGDKLNDGDEVNKYKTDPLQADTDKGSIDDYTEVNRGTDPLDPEDDIVKPVVAAPVVTIDKVVLDKINFDFDSNSLSQPDKDALSRLFAQLKKHPSVKVSLIGYADSSGPEAYNLKLSKRRAQSVKKYLIANGIDADRLVCSGKGEANPVATNKTKEGRAKNRRVEIEKIND